MKKKLSQKPPKRLPFRAAIVLLDREWRKTHDSDPMPRIHRPWCAYVADHWVFRSGDNDIIGFVCSKTKPTGRYAWHITKSKKRVKREVFERADVPALAKQKIMERRAAA